MYHRPTSLDQPSLTFALILQQSTKRNENDYNTVPVIIMPEEQQIYTAIPVRKGDEAVTDKTSEALEEPLLDVESQIDENDTDEEEEELWVHWPSRWW